MSNFSLTYKNYETGQKNEGKDELRYYFGIFIPPAFMDTRF